MSDEVCRLTDAIAWFATLHPDGHAITRRDVAAMQLFAEWASVARLVRDDLAPDQFDALCGPFVGAVPRPKPRDAAEDAAGRSLDVR